MSMFGESKKEEKQKSLFEEQIKAAGQEIEHLRETKRKIQAPGQKPFVWDIDFAEIFGDKGGFDIVIGNPPYVRQEKIAPPNKLKAEVTLENKREYKDKLLSSIQVHYPFVKKLDKKSDYYIYFYFHGLSLLNEKGAFCFITSNSWLDVGYGKDLQEFLLKYCHVKAIYDNEAKRSFEHADVNTIIALLGPPIIEKKGNLWPALKETARFVMLKKPFEEAINTKNLLAIEKADSIHKTESYRVYPVKQETLLEEGWEKPEEESQESEEKTVIARSKATKQSQSLLKEKFITGKYEGNKWGGKYLRAPDIFFTILEKGKGKLVRLGDIAEVRRGFTTGCNEFFYLPSKHFDLKKDGKYYELIPKNEGLPKGIRIEEKYLPFAVLSPRDVDSLYIKSSDLNKHLLLLDQKAKLSQGLNLYIKWGERQKFNQRPTCKPRDKWWSLSGRPECFLACNYLVNDYMRFYCSRKGTWFSDNFQEIHSSKSYVSLAVVLNSIVCQFFINMIGRSNFGGGLLKIQTYEVSDLLSVDPSRIKRNDKFIEEVLINFSDKCNLSIYDQCGLNPAHPVREQKPNPLPERKALDDIVFDILGLTENERKEVYWAVCELVKNRLEKARSV